jgi:hypothetical protein
MIEENRLRQQSVGEMNNNIKLKVDCGVWNGSRTLVLPETTDSRGRVKQEEEIKTDGMLVFPMMGGCV